MKKIVLASNNPGKTREFNQLLMGAGFEVVSQAAFNVPEVAETGLTFVENALIKARHAAQLTGLPAIADDSGIEVDALLGAPGIYSARYAGQGAGDAANLQKLLSDLRASGVSNRAARFQCLLVYLRHATDPTPLICQGTWEGSIIDAPRGHNGFGYDPIFFVASENCTSAELPPERKNALSHRGQALACLLQKLRATPSS
jgi:XTP/dITP diphosphohydrolase